MTSSTPVAFRVANRGPWTVLETDEWAGYCVGQTTALAGGRDPSLHQPASRLGFYRYFPVDSVHEARQVHGSSLTSVGPHSACYRGVDGLFCARSGAMITMRTADCYPVFFRDVETDRFCLLHVGWRGLVDRILPKAMDRWFNRPVDVIVGAGIGVSDYEVDETVIGRFSEALKLSHRELQDHDFLRDGHLDLRKIIEWEVEQSSPPVRSFSYFPMSTASEEADTPPLLSYRQDGTDDRMVSWVFRRER